MSRWSPTPQFYRFCQNCAQLILDHKPSRRRFFCSYRCARLYEVRTGEFARRHVTGSKTKGTTKSEETKRKMSLSKMGHEVTPETRAKLIEALRHREKPSGIERKLAEGLKVRHLKFETEYVVEGVTSIDIAFPEKKVAVFADGCLWHLCSAHTTDRTLVWVLEKRGVKVRDRVVSEVLRSEGWTVLRFWEHEIDDPEIFLQVLDYITKAISRAPKMEIP